MKPIKAIVITTTLFLVFYSFTPSMGMASDLIFILFLIGNFLCIYMVYAILKFGEAPEHTLDEGYWYTDIDK